MGYIELIGLPGAGKSTLIEHLRGRSGAALPSFLHPIDPSFSGLFAQSVRLASALAVRHPRRFAKLAFNREGQWLLTKVAYRWAALNQRTNGGVLIDSGLLQPLISLPAEFAQRPVSTDDILSFVPLLPLPHGIVYLDTDLGTAYERYLMRQYRTGRRKNATVTKLGFRQARDVCKGLVHMLPPERVFKVRGESVAAKDLDAICAQVIDWATAFEGS